jgi:hypothetical protein
MKTKLKIVGLLILSIFFFSNCSWKYYLTTQSLVEQFADSKQEEKVTFFVVFPLIFHGVVTGNSLQEIKVLDKNETDKIISITRHTGVRIIKKDGTKSTFYFNTLIIQDSTITGKKEHFFGTNIKPINLNDIEKIEIKPHM